ncbi:MAG TPA: response regulator [Hungateiclostridium thermocellum]|jgi:CheY-like chemotaxis protein|uniref:Stage 0 sporulation protein A homolog n=2 Tax=Acetivibrio thermocellus TaxID=1515 RepID=A3DDU6_ACET2|nr:response regulator [Acetivibrio thermocellus]CDG35584.1 response regulator receiver protein [Acetivibrio thermocellus BC1]ABN52125.1 response regulator receiver protein [Acetivibrio thermocellus ATCC 27405]ADU74392.1 response regulator receiver protein [Acetivibrio thermocellus DSM 1313]ALX08335.1 response regulator receiver protein [Acetivibrio thermocellus AD2]ANV76083.1 response regulator receiver protein [Acetivibrio thermocellus DSM 2360]
MINTILVIDDNVFDNAIIKNYLSGERYSIISAVNGREALELIESRNIDLILLDIVMPIMDGYDFLKEFSKTPYYKEIPVIVASNLDNAENIEKIFEFEIFDYIIKPLDQINKLIFLNKIKSALKYRNALSELNKATRLINQLSAKEA